ncbi:TonB-dependent receptor domain-containing protein [Confluentibacter sediminis]|uniref:TonB-dependent receptor domain-containing protein n=1 Tax=Confluentibacter sediminis TaxID=2219045 RepID=UPI000DAE722B|nr:TonB-dependent receptor [Confluentibacter sediminis]
MKLLRILLPATLFVLSVCSTEAQRRSVKEDTREVILENETFGFNERQFKGIILDSKTNAPLEYATISAINKKTSGILKGTITDDQGQFSLTIEKEKEDYYFLIEFLGYKPQTISNLDFSRNKIDLGTILMLSEDNQLDEVVVTSEVSKTSFKLDKRVFNVGADLSNSGASSLQILESVPSVTVGMKGDISLRGNSNVKILINGNASANKSNGKAALNGISPDMIERIEVITNPSAKYDAAGSAGILNIILKKERKSGLNGTFTATAGKPESYGLGVNLNYRTNKINLLGGINGEYGIMKSYDTSITLDKTQTPNENRFSNGSGLEKRKDLSANFGMDYNISPTDFLSVSTSMGISKSDSENRYDYRTEVGNTTTHSNRTETGNNKSPNYELNANYKKTLGGKDEHTLEARYSGFNYTEDKKAGFINTGDSDLQQRSNTMFREDSNTAQIDYKYPFGKEEEEGALEFGLKFGNRKLKNDYVVDDLSDGNWRNNTNFTNVFQFNENLWAGYSTYGQEFGKFGVKAGLRLENTRLLTELENTNEKNKQNYTDLFPSLHTSYKFTDALSLQLSYSRRISRPDMFSLNPFESISDQFSQFQGNPALKPEYSNSYEFGTIQNLDKGSLFASVYARTTNNTVEETQQLVNGITIVKPLNIGKRNDLGIEFNGSYRLVDWFKMTSEFNWFYYKRTGNYLNQSFNFNSNQWSAGLISTFKIPIDLDAEVSLNYTSKEKQLLQTKNSNFYSNLGLKKKLFTNRVAVNVSVRDLFNSRRWNTIVDQPSLYRSQNFRWGGRQINLSVSIKLGKADVEGGEMGDYGGDY